MLGQNGILIINNAQLETMNHLQSYADIVTILIAQKTIATLKMDFMCILFAQPNRHVPIMKHSTMKRGNVYIAGATTKRNVLP
jgi:hypothetical protein